ncbi:hypothetical protein LTR37_013684 [Vermiconidia calcicola]|uniref:Uncharacterized protein n=1 Tax=Vermiconidia calcicola TaxID=1690605 RepID=A0ACC3MVU4_9PEZI|nr:hypothetical protein LTR37_013684 [Vermiconidia calcicola]
MCSPRISFLLSTFALLATTLARSSKFRPCPILGPYFPVPRIDADSPALRSALGDFSDYLESYIQNGTGDYGPVSTDTTSFSVALFAGANYFGDEDGSDPFFWEYHHTASDIPASEAQVDADSVFAVGDLTQLFTAFLVLVEEGEKAWARSIVEYLPELLDVPTDSSDLDHISQVDWSQVTLGDLAGHLAGIARDSGSCHIDQRCKQDVFLQAIASTAPVELPGTTPIYSHVGFQLLASAMEAKLGKTFATILTERVLNLLKTSNTDLLHPSTELFGDGLSGLSLTGEPASLGLASSLADLSRFGRAVLTSELITPSQTLRWLKPVSDTSNLRNAVGRPWEIYHFGDAATDPIIDVYTKTASVGRYSSYFGLAPSHDVGFAILAVDTETEAPDLNAYADIVLGALGQIDELTRKQADATLAGTYHDGESMFQLKLTGSDPGLKVSKLTIDGTNWLVEIACRAGIDKASDHDLRLYPTNLESNTSGGGKQQVFQAIIQDKSALVDAGTPTCISWQTVGELKRNGVPLDRFVIETGSDGVAISVTWPALDIQYSR